MTSVLSTHQLMVDFGGTRALNAVDLDVPAATLVGLIGPNGAGKTTLVDAVTGYVRSQGTVEVGGVDVSGLPPYRRARLGVRRTWQAGALFDELSVAENLGVASAPLRVRDIARDIVGPRRRRIGHPRHRDVDAALELLGIEALAERRPADLSEGQRKLVGVARAVVGRPRLLLLDEPAAGLDVDESHALGQRLRSLVADGFTMLLIDHDMGLVLDTCDEIYVLDFGAVLAHGTPAEIRVNPAVVAAYLGASGSGASSEAGTA